MNIYHEMKKAAMNCYSKTALVMLYDDGEKQEYTYGRVLQLVERYADRLKKIGVSAGDRVCIVSESRPEWNIAFMSCAKLNATSVLLDYSLPGGEIRALIKKSQPVCVIASGKVAAKLGDPERVPVLDLENRLEPFRGSAAVLDKSGEPGNGEIGVIIFSSGTTKTASGIMHTHESQIKSCRMVCECNGLTDNERYLGILPNSHIYGLFAQVLAPMLTGSAVCFIESLSARGLAAGFENFKPTILPGVPKVYELLKAQMLKQINSKPLTARLFKIMFPIALHQRRVYGINSGRRLFGKLHKALGGEMKIMCSAGSPMSKDTFEFFYGTGFNIVNNYGATETSIPTIGTYGKHVYPDSCGKVYPDVKMKIDRSGEMLIKSPYMMLGYLGDPKATEEAFTKDGWFRSGDLAKFDRHKNVVILGRCKENIVLATGKKVAPDDIEQAYSNVKGIEELVVCGVPVAEGGFDEVHAFAVCPEEQREQAESRLKEISEGLNQSMRLSGIHFVESVPRTAIGKPKRYLLKKMVMEDTLDCLNADSAVKHIDPTDIPALVRNAVAKAAHVGVNQVHMNTGFLQEFAIDSLSSIELALEIEGFSGVRVDECLEKEMTVGKLIALVQNPNRIRKTTVKSMLYPLDKRKIDYHIYRFYRNLVKFFYEVDVENEENLPDENGYIICANHVSNFDFLFLTVNFRYERFAKFCCMAKKELFKKGFLSRLLVRVAGMVPVDRGGQVADSMSALRTKLGQKWGVLVHPEGTRSKTGEMGKFKSGAAVLSIETGSPIVPAYIKGGHEIFPPDKKMPRLFDWRRLKKYKVKVVYGKPVYPNGESPEALTEKVRLAVLDLKNEADRGKPRLRDRIKAIRNKK